MCVFGPPGAIGTSNVKMGKAKRARFERFLSLFVTFDRFCSLLRAFAPVLRRLERGRIDVSVQDQNAKTNGEPQSHQK